MNQEQIEEHLTEMLEQSEDAIDAVFAGRLKSLLELLSKMHRKYSDGETISRTEIYKYRRFEKEMEFMKANIQSDYKTLYEEINSLMKQQYIDNLLMSGYVYELSTMTDMGYQIPAAQTVLEAVTNPIVELALSASMNQHRNYIVNRIRKELAQGIQAGESYSQMAKRLEDALKFSAYKARRVARTESGRVQVTSRLKSGEQAQKYANLEKYWLSSKDEDVRNAHRKLDGDKADDEGYFHYRGHKAKGPSLFGVAHLDIQCRCDVFFAVNGQKPDTMRVRDYDDAAYQERLAERMDELMADEGLTEKQAERKAKKQIYPPSKVVEYDTYENWYKSLRKAG